MLSLSPAVSYSEVHHLGPCRTMTGGAMAEGDLRYTLQKLR
jgi:hypothetical protein